VHRQRPLAPAAADSTPGFPGAGRSTATIRERWPASCRPGNHRPARIAPAVAGYRGQRRSSRIAPGHAAAANRTFIVSTIWRSP
jgi:hypothetical protein